MKYGNKLKYKLTVKERRKKERKKEGRKERRNKCCQHNVTQFGHERDKEPMMVPNRNFLK
jgi:hypothetical protein